MLDEWIERPGEQRPDVDVGWLALDASRDQAALHGLLDGVCDIGATLLSVEAPDHLQLRKDS